MSVLLGVRLHSSQHEYWTDIYLFYLSIFTLISLWTQLLHTSVFVRSTSAHYCMALPFLPAGPVSVHHGLIIYVDAKAKCRHLKKLTCKGTLRQVFITVYKLEIQAVRLVFSTQLCEQLPLSPSLWFNSTPPSPFSV